MSGLMVFFRRQNGLHLAGQGPKIFLFTLPSLLASLYLQIKHYGFAELPQDWTFLVPIGWVLFTIGFIYWGVAVVQLLRAFPKGVLVTTGAYGIARNPIYSSVTFFVFPSVSFITMTWVYLAVSVFLYTGVTLFIKNEEAGLRAAFGKDYEDYLKRVHRLIPFVKP
jgi:protein-S-isoprenylcysteine O-methyltransferase Ste14